MHALLPLIVLSLPAAEAAPAWADAPKKGPLDAEATRSFMKELARYVEANHLKKDPKSPQAGMVCEYFDPARKGKVDQWVQGEALDTMHDGAWLAAALVSAYRATGDAAYKELLTRWILPFYCKMLNHSDALFSAKRNDARPGAHKFNKEHALQEGEKGFVPYWWDDGASVSLERRRDKKPGGVFACTDLLAGKDNPDFRLAGWSHGSSNHLAQDLGVMLLTGWLLLKDSKDKADLKLADEVALAAKHLHECRMRHHGHIPMCDAPAALANKDAKLMKHVPDYSAAALWKPDNHTTRALYDYRPGQRYAFPGFADDQQYRYYAALAKHAGKVPDALAFKIVYDAFTEPRLYQLYCDNKEAPPGVNRFDLHPYYCKDGRPEDYRSDRRGPNKQPRPIGSRMGPQNMVMCGIALQLLAERKGLWEKLCPEKFGTVQWVKIGTGKKEMLYAWESSKENMKLDLEGGPDRLTLHGAFTTKEFTVEVFSRPEAKGTSARVTMSRYGDIKAVNDEGKALNCSNLDTLGDSKYRSFWVELPWTAARKQTAPWANAIEHGRYSVRIGTSVLNFYLASPEERVIAWLKRELGEGLTTWRAIFKEKGYIPTGLGAGDWDRFSDSGGYAHLIAACAQWLYVLEGKRDWEAHAVPEVK